MSGLLVRPKAYPNFDHPRHQGWFSTSAYIGASTITATGQSAGSGANPVQADFAQRDWAVGTAPARIVKPFLDLTTPAYMLAGTNSSTDSVIGLDYHSPPLKMAKYVQAMDQIIDAGNSGLATLYQRVKAINHGFTVHNYSRFPLKLYYSVYIPEFEPPDISEGTPMQDQTYGAYRCVVVPPVKDAGDRASKRSFTISQNLEKLFPDQYELTPYTHNGNVTTERSPSPWMLVDVTTGNSMYRTCPPGQLSVDTLDVGVQKTIAVAPRLQLKMYAKLEFPVHMGQTAESGATGGEITTNNYYIQADMSWLVESVNTASQIRNHPQTKAYPDQTV